MKTAIVIGHTAKKQGTASLFHRTENAYALEVAKHLGLDTFEFNPNVGYKTGCYELKDKIKNYDLVLHLHFNDFKDHNVNGCECLYWNNNKIAEKMANAYIKTVTEYYDTKVRSSIPMIDKSQRGYYAFKIGGTNLILEPFLGKNKECFKFKSTIEYAKVLAMFIQKAEKLCQ